MRCLSGNFHSEYAIEKAQSPQEIGKVTVNGIQDSPTTMSVRPTSQRGASKAKQPQSTSSLARIPPWAWLLTGMVGGMIIAGMLGINTKTESPPSETMVEGGTNDQPSPVFDFYTLLPASEVTLAGSGETIKVPVEKTRNTSEATPPEHGSQPLSARYLIQAGSFRSIKDADRLKAQLLFWGLTPRIEKVTVGNNEFWHRVQLGPFKTQDDLYSAQQILAEHKIDSLLLKMK